MYIEEEQVTKQKAPEGALFVLLGFPTSFSRR